MVKEAQPQPNLTNTTIGKSIDQWQALISSTLGRLDTEPIAKARRFVGTLSHHSFGQLSCVDLQSTKLEIIRRKQFIADSSEDFFKVNFHLAGQAQLEQNGRFTTLSPGQWVIYDNTRPYTLKFQQNYRQLVLLIPRQQLLSRLPSLNALLIHPQPFHKSLSQFAFQFLQTNLQQPREAAATQLTTDSIVQDLIIAALLEVAPSTQPKQLVTLTQIKQFIHTNLHNPELSVAMIIHACHISKRYLHHLFATEEITAVNYIWAMRLEKCRLALLNPHLTRKTITEIAFAWGFNSNAHFSRRFKKAYGYSPTIFRQRAPQSLHSQSSSSSYFFVE